ncbi:uncharacterized protein LOC115413918 [Sphaeramia orbicularis]|uniref:uncharacterized protein LOC115413918 n=1 Tax=Sphaeramia orbicularis TaxID=375764 RepID=UPI00117FD1DE|nr:uncharacterized protein LOC115413918 [Sphaeramia orbicularis]
MDQPSGPENPDQQTTGTAAAVGTEEVSSSAQEDDTQMDQPSGPENPDQQIKTGCQNEDETFVPRLRRTKSIMMKEKIPEFSDELFDSSLTDVSVSVDEYVPDTTSESEDSDVSLSLVPKRTLPVLSNPGSMSPPVCDSTTLDDGTFDSNSITPEVTGAETPCSSQDMMDTVVVGVSQKKDGHRVYNKRHYCLYCSKPYAKMARHLESAHNNVSEVAKALSFPKSSAERKKQLDYIRNKGNYAHNATVMESGKGELVPFKRPTDEVKGDNFMHCAYCQGLFKRRVLWRHMRCCQVRPASATLKPGKNRVQSMCIYTGPVPSHMSKQLWGVISAMVPDPITEIIKNDHVIIDVGQHLLNKGGMSAKNQQHVREKMRELGRLIHAAKTVTALKKNGGLHTSKELLGDGESSQENVWL